MVKMRYSCACVLAACLLAACLLLLVGGAARADALVGNLVEGLRVTGSSLGIYDHSQRFTTGTSASGYKITGIRIRLGSRSTARTNIPKVRLFSQSPTGTKLADFNGPSTIVKGRGNYTFRPTSTLLLNRQTDYWMTIEDEGAAEPASLVLTLFTGEDAISAAGWDLANTAQIRAAGTNHSFVNFTDLSEFTVRYVANLSVEGTVRAANSPATGKPTISGTARVGQILTADRGTIDDANGVPDVFDYQWIRVEGMTETDISGANEKTYRLTAADGDKKFRVTLSFFDNEGYPEARTGDPYPTGGAVDPQQMNSPATGKPTISGNARVGQILTADRGTIDDANGVPDVFDYQWIRFEGMTETDISGANEKTYRLTAADGGKQLKVTLSFIDNDGYAEARTGDPYPTGGNVTPRPANSPATGKPTISGTASVGQILTADRGTVEDANGMPDVFDYQWIRVEGGNQTNISGANEKTYRLTADDGDTQFRVTLSFIDNEGYDEARTSDPYS